MVFLEIGVARGANQMGATIKVMAAVTAARAGALDRLNRLNGLSF